HRIEPRRTRSGNQQSAQQRGVTQRPRADSREIGADVRERGARSHRLRSLDLRKYSVICAWSCLIAADQCVCLLRWSTSFVVAIADLNRSIGSTQIFLLCERVIERDEASRRFKISFFELEMMLSSRKERIVLD